MASPSGDVPARASLRRGRRDLGGFLGGLMQEGVDDGHGGVGAAEGEGVAAHGLEAAGLGEEAVDLIGQRGEFVALDAMPFSRR